MNVVRLTLQATTAAADHNIIIVRAVLQGNAGSGLRVYGTCWLFMN